MASSGRLCFTGCEFFRCDQRAVVFRGQTTYCRFAEDECTPNSCKYTRCVKGRLLPSGVCGLTLKTKEFDVGLEDVTDPMEIPDKYVQKMKMKKFY